MTSSFLYGTFRANERVCSIWTIFAWIWTIFAHLIVGCTIRYPKIDNLRYLVRSAESCEMCSHSKFSLKLDNKGGKTGRLSMAGAYCRHKKNTKGVYIHMHMYCRISFVYLVINNVSHHSLYWGHTHTNLIHAVQVLQ